MANVQIDSMTDTWNAGGTTFNAIKMNVTDTASAAASKLIDLQVGGNTKANVTKAGLLTLASGVTLTGANTLQTTTGALTLVSGSSNIVLTPSSNVGIGTTGPDKKLDVLDASAAQLRLTHTDGSVYTDFQTLSTGHQLMTTTGGNRITSTTVNDTSVLARQVQGGLAFDGTATTGASATIGAVGLSDCTLHFTYRVPDTAITSGSYSIGIQSATGSTGNGDFAARLNSNGIDVLLQAGGLYTRVSFNPITLYAGKVITVDIIRSSATTLTTYINGVATTFSDVSSTTTPNLIDLTSTVFREWCSAACDKPITVYGATLFNRALSASEVITLANQGVQEADKWGVVAPIYDSNRAGGFDSGTDGFVADGSTITGNVDGIGGQDNNLSINGTAATAPHRTYKSFALTLGKRYKVSYTYYMPVAANPTAKRITTTCFGNLGTVAAPVDSAWTTVNLPEFTYTGPGVSVVFYLADSSGSSTYAGSASDILYLRDVTVTQIGSILDADLSAGVGYQVPDRSSNKYHGVVSATGTSWTLAQRRGQVRATTNTPGNERIFSSQVCLPTNAIITSIVGYTTGTPTVYVGNVSGGSQLVASVAMSASTYTSFTLAAITSTTGNVWVNSSTSDTINWTITYMIADP